MESSDSLGGLLPTCPTSEEKRGTHSRSFQALLDGLDEEDYVEEAGKTAEKKRRLRVDQVKALEKNFEQENKLEPERKVKLAQELGLQPRQVAVWFQNRRARWKTKQLERDYSVLKANYETLKASYESLQKEKESLAQEVQEQKDKLKQSGMAARDSERQQEEMEMVREEEIRATEQSNNFTTVNESAETKNTIDQKLNNIEGRTHGRSIFSDSKDCSDDSDSSAILNDHNSPHIRVTAVGIFPQQSIDPPALLLSSSSSLSSHHTTFHQFLKMEDHNFLNYEDSCDFFNDEQLPTMPWYYSEVSDYQWK